MCELVTKCRAVNGARVAARRDPAAAVPRTPRARQTAVVTLRRLAALALLGAIYFRFLRSPILNWGATPEEAAAALPGDELLLEATA